MFFSVGLNDCGRTDGENEVPIEDYHENLKVIVEEARKTVDTVIAVGLTPVIEERLNEEDSLAFYTNSMFKQYDDVMLEVCEEKDVKFIPVFEKLQGDDWTENLFDGLHPNTEGHRKIFELVKNDIKAELNL